MNPLLSKVLDFFKKHYRFFIAAGILAVCVYLIFISPPRIMRGADDYIKTGDQYYEERNFEEALRFYRNAKYFQPESFEINIKIATTLIQMPPIKNSGFLIRHYLQEALKAAKNTSQIQKILMLWQSKPDLEVKFANSGMVRGTAKKQLQAINARLKRQKKIQALQCSNFSQCIEIAKKAFDHNNYAKAEKYYIKAINIDDSPKAEANFQKAMMQIIILYFSQDENCKPQPWNKIIRKHADGSIGNDTLKPELLRYYKLKHTDCMSTARTFSYRLGRDLEKQKADLSTPLVITLDYYKMASQLMLAFNPAKGFWYYTEDEQARNKKIILESLKLLDKKPKERIEKEALLYEKTGKHIKNWKKTNYRDFKKTAIKYLARSKKLYQQAKNRHKVTYLNTLITSLR